MEIEQCSPVMDSVNGEIIAASIQFEHFDVLLNVASDHHYIKNNQSCRTKNPMSRKIMKEWKILKNNLPESIYVQVYEPRIDLLRAVIIGSPMTPYHDGLFFFDIFLPSNYPDSPPKVYYRSHGYRLNPNLYANGYVCLSLINTWNGTGNERWRKESTILQLLVSIQGLVLNEIPFFNEPLLPFGKNSKILKNTSKSYSDNVFILSCKTMLQIIRKPPEGFEVLVVEHFKERSESILAAVKAYQNGDVPVGQFQMNGASSSSSSVEVSSTLKNKLKEIGPHLEKAFGKKIPKNMELEDTTTNNNNNNNNNNDAKKPQEHVKKHETGLWNKFGKCFFG